MKFVICKYDFVGIKGLFLMVTVCDSLNIIAVSFAFMLIKNTVSGFSMSFSRERVHDSYKRSENGKI